jgi:hypothetical protein
MGRGTIVPRILKTKGNQKSFQDEQFDPNKTTTKKHAASTNIFPVHLTVNKTPIIHSAIMDLRCM